MDIFALIENDRFAREAGCRLVSCGNGEAVVEVELQERHLNGVGTAQGGLIFTLADTAFAAAANEGGQQTVSLSAAVSFLRAPRAGTLRAHAMTVSRGRSTCCIDVTVTDGEGRTVAKVQCSGFSREGRPEP